MSYLEQNFRTKRALKLALVAGDVVTIKPGPFDDPDAPDDARTTVTWFVEGPHYPEPHTWYAQVEAAPDGRVLRLIR